MTQPAVGEKTVDETDLVRRLAVLSLEQKVRLLTGADSWALHAEPAAGLRRLVTSDGPAGVRGERWDERDTSANVPSPTALAASWDEAAVRSLGRLLAAEARRKGVDVFLAPTVNLHRSPYGGRHFECFSEDPLLTGRIGSAYVRGVQEHGVAATVKHFVANDSETQRFTLDARVDERTLRELYLAPFEAIVREAGVWAVMAAYNGVNGHTATEQPMLRDVLKGEWGFDGLVMSDWYAGRSLAAAGAGLDLAMPGPTGPWGDALVAAVRDGRVDESAVDDKVLRLLRLAARVGALEGTGPGVPLQQPDADVRRELRAAAAAGFVLARNDGVLPLAPAGLRTVAILGPNAAVARTLGGGSATVFPTYTVSPLDGLRAALGSDVEVTHVTGVRTTERVPATVELLRLPDGSGPGVEARYVAGDATVLGRESRGAAQLTWMGSYLPGIAIADAQAVELHTRLVAPADGTYLVGASGVGPFRLALDGEPAFDERIELPPGADPVEAMMRPPQRHVEVGLRAGDEVEVVLRHEPEAAGGFGEAAVQTVTFGLNVARQIDEEAEFAAAIAAAAAADVAIVVVGTTEEVESEGFDRDTLALPGRQDDMVRRVAAVNPRTIVVVNSGAPVLLPWAGEVAAVLLTWFPGQEYGNALADVLLGAAEPGGRLPVSWPRTEDGLPSVTPVDGVLRYDEGLFIGYRAYDRDGREPQYAFGHGLGYTSWEFLAAQAEPDSTDGVTVGVQLRNTGERAGRTVVQVYASRPESAVDRPNRWLAGFALVDAAPGAEVTATVAVAARAFEHWDVESHRWVREPGTFVLQVGSSSAALPLSIEVVPG